MKLINIISWITILFAIAIVLTISYWSLYNYKTVEFELPHKILNENKQVVSGGHLLHEARYCKYTNVTPLISKYFEDGILYLIPDQVATFKEVGCDVLIVSTYIPRALPLGTYTLKATYKYHVNPIREIDVFTETETFEIIADE